MGFLKICEPVELLLVTSLLHEQLNRTIPMTILANQSLVIFVLYVSNRPVMSFNEPKRTYKLWWYDTAPLGKE